MKKEESYLKVLDDNKTSGFVNRSEDEKLREAVFKSDIEKLHLIQNKKATNQPKDQVDIIYFEKIKEIQDNKKKSLMPDHLIFINFLRHISHLPSLQFL